jgi:hypothetical protein
MHGGEHDRTVFYFEKEAYAGSTIVDTQRTYAGWQDGGKPGLAMLAEVVLGITDFRMSGDHSSVEDARATMKLWIAESQYDRDAEALAMGVGVMDLGRRVSKEGKAEKGGDAWDQLAPAPVWKGRAPRRDLYPDWNGPWTIGGVPLDV